MLSHVFVIDIFSFFKKIKMEYISYDVGDPLVQGVPEGPTWKNNQSQSIFTKQGQSILRQDKRSDHQF